MDKLNIMLEHSVSIAKLAEALNLAQKDMEKAKKDSDNPFFESKYADLSAVWDACKDAVLSNGFSIMQPPAGTDEHGNVLIVTLLAHISGEWIKGVLPMPISKPIKAKDGSISYVADPQTVGSAITYGRRYSLAAMLNIMLEDDDAECAMNRAEKYATKSAPQNKQSYTSNKVIKPVNAKASPKQLQYFKSLINAGKISSEKLEQAKINHQVEMVSNLPVSVISQLINEAIAA